MYSFLGFELDTVAVDLRRHGARVPIAPQSLTALIYLLNHRERVVSGSELTEELWPDLNVGEGSLRQVIWAARQALGDAVGEPRIIRTLRGQGYQFIAPLNPDGRRAAGAERPAATGFFGRKRELAQLDDAFEAASRVSGRACLVVGAPGIGKSRLVRELALEVAPRGGVVSEGHTDADGAAPPFSPWFQLLSSALQHTNAVRRAAYEHLAPTVFRVMTQAPAAAWRATASQLRLNDDAPTQLRSQLMDELGNLFRNLLTDTPRLLLIDDLHCADEASLSFLRHFARVLPQTRALLVVTSRAQPARQDRDLSRALEALMRVPLNERIDLADLTVDDIASMVSCMTASAAHPALASDIHALSHGNPLFALELSRLFAGSKEHGTIPREQVGVQALIRRRVDGLQESGRDAVLAASVLSQEFSLAELAGVLDEHPSQVLTRLDLCIASGLLVEVRVAERYRFAHPLARDAAYGCLTPSLRARLHQRAGEWLERRGAGARVAHLDKLARHFTIAAPNGVADKAVHYATRCAERAYAATAYKRAVSYYDQALQCSDLVEFDSAQRLELELARGEALRAAGEPAERVNQLFLRLAERASALDDAELLARAALGYAGQRSARFTPTRFVSTVSAEEVQLLERALRAIGEEDSELRVLLLSALVFALIYSVDRARREKTASEALRVARRLGNEELTARVLFVQILACAAPDSHKQRLDACGELIALAHARGLKEQEVVGRILRALLLLGVADVEGSLREERRAQLLAEELGSPRVKARSELLALMRAYWEGDLDRAERMTQQALDVAKDDVSEQTLHLIRMSTLRVLRTGAVQEVLAINEAMLASYPDALACRCALAQSYASLDQPESARRHFDWVARDDFAHLPEDIVWLSEMISLGEAAARMRDHERSRLIYRKLLPYGETFAFYAGGAIPAGPVAFWLSSLAIAMEEYTDAERWLSCAQALNEKLGAQLYTQCGRVLEAHLILLTRPHEAARAHALLDSVTSFAQQRSIDALRVFANEVRDEATPLETNERRALSSALESL